jgi:SagB-type dehydrogenase family enzyme
MTPQWHAIAFGSENDSPLWELFHENSKLGRFSTRPSDRDIEQYMIGLHESLPYNGFPTILLPKRLLALKMPIGKTMLSRVSIREMTPYSLRLNQLAALLHYSYGVNREKKQSGSLRSFRVVPSAGALYPIEIYFQTVKVKSLPTGLYHYNPLKHHLRRLRDEHLMGEIAHCFVPGTIPEHTSVLIFLTALFQRSTFKYGERGYRFALLEAGHIAQNINLVSSALKLGCLNIGGFFNRELDALLHIDGINHSTVYVLAVGMKQKTIAVNKTV